MPGLALALYVLDLLVAFVLRGVLQWRCTGDSGFRLGAEVRWSAQWWARLGFVAALVASAAAPVADLADWLDPVGALDRPWLAVVGAVVAVAGVAGTFVAQLAMGASWRVGVDPDETTALVVRWPFTVVRNPIFSTMAVAAVGFTLLVPSVLAIGGLVALLASLAYQVRVVEEPHLRRVHGEAYLRYAARVGRFVPGVGRLLPDGRPPVG